MGGWFSVDTISTDLDGFNVRLLARDHAETFSSSATLESTFCDGIMTFTTASEKSNFKPEVKKYGRFCEYAAENCPQNSPKSGPVAKNSRPIGNQPSRS